MVLQIQFMDTGLTATNEQKISNSDALEAMIITLIAKMTKNAETSGTT